MIERALTERWEVVEIPIRRKNGDTRVALWNSANVYAEDGTTVLAIIAQGQDITARKLAEEALKDSEARYRLVFETANEGIWVTDGTWKTVLVNQRMADMLGYSVDELQGRVPAEFLQADQGPTVLKARGDLAAGATINREFKFRRKDGSDLWVISSAAPVKDPEGRLIRTVSMLTDITERKAAEDAIRASEAKLRGVLDATQESIWVFDPDGIVLLANAVGLARMRREARDIIGKRMMEILPRDLGRSRMERLREVVGSARPAEFEDERAGLLFHHSFCPALDSAGRVMFVVSFSQDITERKRAEEALRASEGRFRALTETSSLAVGVSSSDGKFLYVNRAYEKLFGYTQKELDHLDASELWRTPEDRRRMLEDIRSKGFLIDYEVELKRKNGTPFWAMLSVNSVDYGGDQAIMASVYDITERKKAEALRLALAEQDRVRLGAAVEQASDSVVMFDLDGTIRYVNAAFESVNRLPAGEGRGPLLFRPPGRRSVGRRDPRRPSGKAWPGTGR